MSTEESTGTAVATTSGVDQEVASIEQAGRLAVRRNRSIREVYRQMNALEWGKGLSDHTRGALAAFCHDVGANPAYHVDLLGGKPYLNANYWSDRINGEPHYMGFEQFNISADKAERAAWDVPEWAACAVVTEIRRFINAAPIEKIRAGEVHNIEPFVTTVRECNWAGGRPASDSKKDPIGNAEPAKTARTRSLRRCAARAFEAIRIQNQQLVEKAETLMLAEWEAEIQQSQRELLRHNPRGLPAGELVPAVVRGHGGDWQSVRVDPALITKPEPLVVRADDPRSQAQREDDEAREREEAARWQAEDRDTGGLFDKPAA